MNLIEIIKALILGILEGITEWLPISSTGHLIIFQSRLKLAVSDDFWRLFEVVIQLGAILAVIILYFRRLNPISKEKTKPQRKETLSLWGKIMVATLPSAVVGAFLDDWLEKRFFNETTVAAALIIYGLLFVVLEKKKKNDCSLSSSVSYKQALGIGLFQVLALIPGTSRSGATILGGRMLGVSRPMAAEFSFFLAIPTMLGASLLKTIRYLQTGLKPAAIEWILLSVGFMTAFFVSLITLRSLVAYVRGHGFSLFGIYRILLGVLILFLFWTRA